LWIGTTDSYPWGADAGGLAHYTAQGGWQVLLVFDYNPNSKSGDSSVYSLSSDGQDGVWVGTVENGLVHYTAQGKWQVFNTENSLLPSNYVPSLLSDSQGGLWVGTVEGGLAHLTFGRKTESPQTQVQIHLNKTTYQRGESFTATLTEDLSQGYDLYAAVVLPDGNFMTLNETNSLGSVNESQPWYAQRKPGNAITLFDLTLPADLPTGQYCLYGILSPEQNDVFETKEKGLWVYGNQCFEVYSS
jgi:hypothetical protein